MTAVFYAAPLEGITNMVYRQVHHRMFPGADKYFIPFISPTEHLTFSSREQREFDPKENEGLTAVPQILTAKADLFVSMARLLADCGYTEINLNLGCPSGTVTAKGKGSGALRDPDSLRALLDGIYADSPLPVSIKTRIGFSSPDEWEKLWEIFRTYPVSELIVHMRTREMFYKGTPYTELSGQILHEKTCPFIYNGELFTAGACRSYLAEYPAEGLMLGRGLTANPALIRELKGGSPITREEVIAFRTALIDAYRSRWPDKAVLGHMLEADTYLSSLFRDVEKPRKAMRKSRNMEEYREASRRLYENCEMREDPGFSPDRYQ